MGEAGMAGGYINYREDPIAAQRRREEADRRSEQSFQRQQAVQLAIQSKPGDDANSIIAAAAIFHKFITEGDGG